MPFDPLAGTWSGDVRINSNVAFAGGGNAVDLYTALLQEAGHAFGLSNSANSSSVMFETYQGPRAGLGAEDVSRIQALYGARRPDAYEGASGNDTFATASPLAGVGTSDGVVSWRTSRADLTTPQDVDVYRIDTPDRISGLLLRLERAGTSLVTPRVTVYDFLMNPVATVASTDPLGADLDLRLNLVFPRSTYYVKVEGAGGGVFDVGSYRLHAQTLPWFSGVTGFLPDAAPPPGAPLNDDHTDDTFATATPLPPNGPQAGAGFDYGVTATLRDVQDVDYYLVQAPDLTTGSRVVTVMAWGLQNGGLQPRVQVFDASQSPLPARVLVNESGTLTFQIDAFVPGASYVVRGRFAGRRRLLPGAALQRGADHPRPVGPALADGGSRAGSRHAEQPPHRAVPLLAAGRRQRGQPGATDRVRRQRPGRGPADRRRREHGERDAHAGAGRIPLRGAGPQRGRRRVRGDRLPSAGGAAERPGRPAAGRPHRRPVVAAAPAAGQPAGVVVLRLDPARRLIGRVWRLCAARRAGGVSGRSYQNSGRSRPRLAKEAARAKTPPSR